MHFFINLSPRILLIAAMGSVLLLRASIPSTSHAGDWPQIHGPNRNGQAKGETLLAKWPSTGPRNLWSYSIGEGFAGPVAVGNRVIVFHRVGTNERIEAINATTGESVWKADFSATYRGGINPDTGPRSTPVIHGDAVYAFGAAGDMHCVALADGNKRWSRTLFEDHQVPGSYFGAGSSPIVAAGRLIVNLGGRNEAGLVALALDSGRLVWKSTSEGASYSSPTEAVIRGRRQVVFLTRYNTISIDPTNGKELFSFPFGQRGPTVNGATPLVFGDQLFVSSSYGVGAKMVDLSDKNLKTIWANDKTMSSQYTTCVEQNGYLYGIDGREDSGQAHLRCIAAKTGKILWSEDRFGVAHIILSGGKLLILTIDGRLVLAEASPQGYRKLASGVVSQKLTRALPALSQGKFFLRDNGQRGGGGELKCFVVGK